MGFQRKSVVIGTSSQPEARGDILPPNGVRPSPLDGRPTLSTGTASLDSLFSGHFGLPLGTSVLAKENGATDVGGVLLRYYAAEGLVQGHHVHLLGYGESWRSELPALQPEASVSKPERNMGGDTMRIAWRYSGMNAERARETGTSSGMGTFCHTFDLSKRLKTKHALGELIPYSYPADGSPLRAFVSQLAGRLASSQPGIVHRVIVPNVISPAIYGSASSTPEDVLQFMHGLRALLRRYSERVSVFLTFPGSLYPRTSGLVRWMEGLSDSVLELTPSPSLSLQDAAQGILNVRSLLHHERRGVLTPDDPTGTFSFKLSLSKGLAIRPYSLPPVLDGHEGNGDGTAGGSHTAGQLSF